MKIGEKIGTYKVQPVHYIGNVAHHPMAATCTGRALHINDDGSFAPSEGKQTHLYRVDVPLVGRSGQQLPFTWQRWAKRVRQSLRIFSWGGARPGAGRPAIDNQPMLKKTISITPEQEQRLLTLGDGNLSAGLRKLLDVS